VDAKGIQGNVVSPFVVEEILGVTLFENQSVYGLLAIVGTILITFGIFSYERKQNMLELVHASKEGRTRWYLRKMMSMGISITALWLVIFLVNWINISKVYQIGDRSILVQNFPVMGTYPVVVSLGGYIFLMYLSKLVLMLAVAGMVMCISSIFTYYSSMLVSLLLLLPHLLLILGFDVFNYVSIVSALNGTENWAKCGNSIMYYLSGVVIILVGIAGYLYSARKVIKT